VEQLVSLVVAAVLWVLGAILWVLGAAFSRQVTDEFKAWTPWLTDRLTRYAVRKLPENQRERCREEWRSDINDTPGEIGKIYWALGLLLAPSRMPSAVVTLEPLEKPAEEDIATKGEVVLPPFMARPMFVPHYGRWQSRPAIYTSDDRGRARARHGRWMAYADTMQGVPPGETPIALRESVREPPPRAAEAAGGPTG
jgi:hypothetical protein